MRKTILAGALGAALIAPVAASAGGFAVQPRAHHHAAVSVHAPVVLVNGYPQRLAFGHRRYHRHALRHERRAHCAYPAAAHRVALRHHRYDRHYHYDRHYRHHARYRAFPQPGLFLSFAYHD